RTSSRRSIQIGSVVIKRLRQSEDAGAHPERGSHSGCAAGMGGEQLVEASETGGRDRAVALRHRDERRLEVSTEDSVLAEIWVETARSVTQPDDLAADRERR